MAEKAVMSTGPASIPVIAVLFLATLIRSSFGFGEALVAVPLLALLMPVKVAAPVAVLVSITVALMVVLQDWGKVYALSAAGWCCRRCWAFRWVCCSCGPAPNRL